MLASGDKKANTRIKTIGTVLAIVIIEPIHPPTLAPRQFINMRNKLTEIAITGNTFSPHPNKLAICTAKTLPRAPMFAGQKIIASTQPVKNPTLFPNISSSQVTIPPVLGIHPANSATVSPPMRVSTPAAIQAAIPIPGAPPVIVNTPCALKNIPDPITIFIMVSITIGKLITFFKSFVFVFSAPSIFCPPLSITH